jgi:hypothetical protein
LPRSAPETVTTTVPPCAVVAVMVLLLTTVCPCTLSIVTGSALENTSLLLVTLNGMFAELTLTLPMTLCGCVSSLATGGILKVKT